MYDNVPVQCCGTTTEVYCGCCWNEKSAVYSVDVIVYRMLLLCVYVFVVAMVLVFASVLLLENDVFLREGRRREEVGNLKTIYCVFLHAMLFVFATVISICFIPHTVCSTANYHVLVRRRRSAVLKFANEEGKKYNQSCRKGIKILAQYPEGAVSLHRS